jgi:glycosyltransferase involved in cell wall biosynthesis
MKIAQVAPLYESVPPRLYGGTERVVSFLTEALVEQGQDVTLFASGDSETRAHLVPVCPRALRLDEQVIDSQAWHTLLLEAVASRADQFDVIHFHCDYIHFPLSRRLGVPHLTTLHGRLDAPDLVPLYREFSETPLVSISTAQRRPLSFANWIGTVHHGLPEDLLRPHEERGEYLAFIGRISPEKRADRAIDIARRFGMELRIAAKVDPADREYFEREIEPRLGEPGVEFVGEIGDLDKNDFLGGAHALLFPIDWPEPFGLVMIESMACGTPVLAFRCGSVPEVVDDGLTGFVVDDLDQAVDALHRIGDIDRSLCRHAFEKRFGARRMVRDYLSLYRRLAAHGLDRELSCEQASTN